MKRLFFKFLTQTRRRPSIYFSLAVFLWRLLDPQGTSAQDNANTTLTSSLKEIFGLEKRVYPGEVFWTGMPGGRRLFATDLNKDGLPDLVGVGSFQSMAYYNGGSGDFTDFQALDVGSGTQGLLADLNGDGFPDLAALDYSQNLLIAFGTSAGGFAAATKPLTTTFREIVAGDINHDGRADLIGRIAGKILIFLSNPDGTLTKAGEIDDPSTPSFAMVLGDFSGDGNLDLCWATDANSPSLKIALGDGKGGFQEAGNLVIQTTPTMVLAADFDADGKLDLAVAAPDSQLLLISGTGDGHLATPQVLSLNVQDAIDQLDFLDTDHDGKKEIVAQIFHNGITQRRVLAIDPSSGGQNIRTIYQGDGIAPFCFVDLNGDGWLDGVAPVSSGIEVLYAKPGGLLANSSRIQPANWGLSGHGLREHLLTVDIDGDGYMDLATEHGTLLFGSKEGSLSEVVLPDQLVLANQGTDVAVVDVNGDQKPDVLVSLTTGAFPGNAVRVFVQGANRSFPTHVDFATDAQPVLMSVLDVNHDQKADIVTLNNVSSPSQTSLDVLLGNGDGTFQAKLSLALPAVQNRTVLARHLFVGDVTGDGAPDVVVASQALSFYTEYVTIFENSGAAPFLKARAPIQLGDRRSLDALAWADFNKDGKLDLVMAQYSATGGKLELGCYFGDGAGGFVTGPVTPVPYSSQMVRSPRFMLAADVDNNGYPDLVTMEGELTGVFFGKGTGQFAIQQTFFAGIDPATIAVGDLNGDGWPELLSYRGYIDIFPNQSFGADVAAFSLLGKKMDHSPEIERIRDVFRPYDAEIKQIIFVDWNEEFRRRLLAWLAKFLEALLAYQQGQPSDFTVTRSLVDEINPLLDELENRATPGLQAALSDERSRVQNFEVYLGYSFPDLVDKLGLQEELRILKAQFLDRGFSLLIDGAATGNYTLLRALTLGANAWSSVNDATKTADGAQTVLTDPNPPAGTGFYKVQKNP